MKARIKILSVIAGGIILAACAPKYFQGQIHPAADDRPLKEIALIPFQKGTAASLTGEDPEVLREIQTARVEPQGARLLSDLFTESIRTEGRFNLRAPSAVADVIERLRPELESLSAQEGALRVGKELGVDAVLTGAVLAFEERKGGPVAVDRPARVGFTATLIAIPDGQVLWSGQYFERQEALSQNMGNLFLFWRRSGRWLTAAELAEYGVAHVLKTWPAPRDPLPEPQEDSS